MSGTWKQDASILFDWIPGEWLDPIEARIEQTLQDVFQLLVKDTKSVWSFTIRRVDGKIQIQEMVLPELLDEASYRLNFIKRKYAHPQIPNSVLVVSIKMPDPHVPREVLMLYDLTGASGSGSLRHARLTQTILT